jgi:hypothetical protein
VTARSAITAAALLSLALATVAPDAAARKPKLRTWTFSFAADTLGLPPSRTVPFGGEWAVIEDSSRAPTSPEGAAPDSGAAMPRVVRQSNEDDGIRFHYLQFPKPTLGDMVASVRFRILRGEMDPSAGLLFQLDPKGRNGYLVRASGAEGQLVAHYLLSGKRRDLRFSKIPKPDPNTWHTLEVERVGISIIARYDGEEKFRIRDERFTSGCVGLWTEDDTVVDFEGLTVSTR